MGNVQNNATAALPVISDETEASLLEALQTIFRSMAPYSVSSKLDPSAFEASDRATRERMTSRALNALDALAKHRKEQEIAQFRQGVRDAISPFVDAARSEREEYDNLSATLRAKLGAFPSFVLIPVASLSEAFPGLDTPAQIKKLHDLGYKVAKDSKGAMVVKQDLPKSIVGEASSK